MGEVGTGTASHRWCWRSGGVPWRRDRWPGARVRVWRCQGGRPGGKTEGGGAHMGWAHAVDEVIHRQRTQRTDR